MASLTAGTTFVDGVANDVTAAKLGALVTNATPTSGLIQDRTAETVVAINDTLLIGDASDSNNLKRMTVANLLKAPLVSTSGTIDVLTTGTTTSTAEIVTSGTIATLNSTTGTIATLNSTTGTIATLNSTTGTITNLSATTSTFLGAITGSTNVVNIGSGQIYKDASGNVGIGTASPFDTNNFGKALDIRSSTGAAAYFRDSDDASKYAVTGFFGADNNAYLGSLGASTGAVIYTSGTERLRIDSSGRVGIGVTPSNYKLEISGTGANSGFTAGISLNGGQSGSDYDSIGYNFRPTATSNVYNYNANDASSRIEFNSGGFLFKNAPAGTAGNQITYTERLRIDSSGNVGIGVTNPDAKIDVRTANAAGQIKLTATTGTNASYATFSNTGGGFIVGRDNSIGGVLGSGSAYASCLYSQGAYPMAFFTDSTERLRIDSSGNLLVGNTTRSEKFSVVNSGSVNTVGAFVSNVSSDVGQRAVYIQKYDNTNTTSQIFIQFAINQGNTNSGQINANGASQAAFGSFSDIRLKENIENLPSQIDKICSLRPVEFDYKDGSGHQIGFIAQEINLVYPDTVNEGSDGMLTVTGWSKTEARLVRAIQELKAENDSLKSRVTALEAA